MSGAASGKSGRIGFGARSAPPPLCYLRGTRILTTTGEVCIEDLRIGDLVVTRFNGILPVRWIGRQSFDARFVKDDPARIPVCIHAGALGEKQPARDLSVSPSHAMLIGGQLILAKYLVNGISITQSWMPTRVDYFNLDLGRHDCVVAEGAWSETYADAGDLRGAFDNAAEYAALYPDTPPPEERVYCAPRPERGAALAACLLDVVARAAAKPGPLRGFIDRIEPPWKISGWAHDTSHPELPVLLEVVLDDRVIGTVLAAEFRGDLLEAGIGQGRCAFAFTSSERLRPEHIGRIGVRRAADGAPLKPAATIEPVTQPARKGLRLVS
jgi:hypothetical protein